MDKPGPVDSGFLLRYYGRPEGFLLEKSYADQYNTACRHPGLPLGHRPPNSGIRRRSQSFLPHCRNRTCLCCLSLCVIKQLANGKYSKV
jgi:hypothetical protein